MRYGNEMIHVNPPGLLLSTVLPTSMMLKNSASCSIGSLKSSLSMCDKMVAGKKYLSGGVWVEEGVCVWKVLEKNGPILIPQDWEWDKFILPPVVK